jgi:hypothetical protein
VLRVMPMPTFDGDVKTRIARIAASYLALTGRALVPGTQDDLVAKLWSAPFAVLAHGTEPDPIFFFGNATALSLFEIDFAQFTRLPSRLSAELLQREERVRLLERVARDGIIADYSGVRISASGRRFLIRNAAVWNLTDDRGRAAGQAARFAEWEAVG